MKIITISGLDGSGKSTQIEMLKSYLENQDKKVYYFHAIQFGIAKKISEFKNKYCIICKLTGKCKTGTEEKGITKANGLQIFLRRIFLMIDIKRFGKLKKKLEKENFEYILSDRYFYDTVVNINFLRKLQKILPCEKFILKPDAAFYLQADPKKIMSRERKPDQGLEYLQKKKELYDQAAPIWNLQTIDGNRNKEEIQKEILTFVQQKTA